MEFCGCSVGLGVHWRLQRCKGDLWVQCGLQRVQVGSLWGTKGCRGCSRKHVGGQKSAGGMIESQGQDRQEM